MERDIFYNKMANIEKGINKIIHVYNNDLVNLKDVIKQDCIILNILKVSESSIDLAMHIVAENRLGIPQTSNDAFEILENNNILKEALSDKMKAMTCFRNKLLHDYEHISTELLKGIIENNLLDFYEYIKSINNYVNDMGENN